MLTLKQGLSGKQDASQSLNQKKSPRKNRGHEIMKIDKIRDWILPSGIHQARIIDVRVRQNNDGPEECLHMKMELTSLVHPTKRYMARKVYRSNDGRALVADLEHLLDGRTDLVINLAGEIIPEGLLVLKDQLVDIEIEHIRGRNHEEPFCLVSQIKKSGELITTIGD